MPEGNHKQRKVQVWVEVDEGIADLVLYLNTIPDVWTHASCQGTIGEGGPAPYRPQVMVSWDNNAAFKRLCVEFDMSGLGGNPTPDNGWGYVHPREAVAVP